MEEKQSSEKTQADSDAFELDLEADTGPVDRVIEEAMAAVERRHGEGDGEASARTDGAEGGSGTRVAELEAEVRELRERSTRTLADFDNYRKRSERERESLRRYALTNPLRDFLDVVDNIERAISASGSAEDLKQGLEMTLRQLEELLRRYGVEPVEAVGRVFDPKVHEAVSRQESDEVETATVAEEMQKGYVLHERLLRPARVTVLVPSASAAAEKKAEVDAAN